MEKEHPRIVSLVPSWTETLYHFGLDTEIVGVTKWCVHPKELTERVEKVGGTKNPDVARIVALKPDLVVCEHEENRRDDVEALQAAGVPVWISQVESVEASLREIHRLGVATGKEESAAALVQRIEDTLADVRAQAPEEPVPVYVPIWRRPWMTFNARTYAHHVLAVAGARNVFAEHAERYPEASPEDAFARGATGALLPSEPYPFSDKHVGEFEEAGFLPKRVKLADGEALTWYGARAVEGLRQIARSVHEIATA